MDTENFWEIVDHYKEKRDNAKIVLVPKLPMNQQLWEKFKKFKSKYPVISFLFIFIQIKTKAKSVKMIVNKENNRRKREQISEEAKTKKINQLETGTLNLSSNLFTIFIE